MSKGKWLYASCNQEYQLFTVGTTTGFIVYDSQLGQEKFQVTFGKGVGIVECLQDSNIIVFTGGGPNPVYPPERLIVWDDDTNSNIAEIEFPETIIGVKVHLFKFVFSFTF